MLPNRKQTITWTNDDPIYPSSGHNVSTASASLEEINHISSFCDHQRKSLLRSIGRCLTPSYINNSAHDSAVPSAKYTFSQMDTRIWMISLIIMFAVRSICVQDSIFKILSMSSEQSISSKSGSSKNVGWSCIKDYYPIMSQLCTHSCYNKIESWRNVCSIGIIIFMCHGSLARPRGQSYVPLVGMDRYDVIRLTLWSLIVYGIYDCSLKKAEVKKDCCSWGFPKPCSLIFCCVNLCCCKGRLIESQLTCGNTCQIWTHYLGA